MTTCSHFITNPSKQLCYHSLRAAASTDRLYGPSRGKKRRQSPSLRTNVLRYPKFIQDLTKLCKEEQRTASRAIAFHLQNTLVSKYAYEPTHETLQYYMEKHVAGIFCVLGRFFYVDDEMVLTELYYN
jgi:hypothetical protein